MLPSAVSVSINTTDASCFGLNDGQAIATPSGGTSPYTLTWTSVLTGEIVDNNNLLSGPCRRRKPQVLSCSS